MNTPAFWQHLLETLRLNTATTPEPQAAWRGNLVRQRAPVHAQVAVMGGCVRDWFFGLDPKDIDIVIKSGYNDWGQDAPITFNTEELRQKLVDLGWERLPDIEVDPVVAAGYDRQRIVDIWNFKVYDTVVQLIWVPQDVWSHYYTFDHSMTQAAYSLEAGLRFESTFMGSVTTQDVMITSPGMQNLERSKERAQKFIDRLPNKEDWTISEYVPDPLNEFF